MGTSLGLMGPTLISSEGRNLNDPVMICGSPPGKNSTTSYSGDQASHLSAQGTCYNHI